jgi:hypothetical protein
MIARPRPGSPGELALNRQQERYARNESLFREVNERIAEVNENFEVEDQMDFLCECGREECLETVRLTRTDYERIRADGTCFVVKPGHEDAAVEEIAERHDEFLVVVKSGEAGEEAEERDPRS